jgi:hypothetical protein
LAQNALNLTPEELMQVVEFGFLRSFQPEEIRQAMAKDAVDKFKALLKDPLIYC